MDNNMNNMNNTNATTHEMPTVEWFASLPTDRREKALRAMAIYRMTTDPVSMELHLRPHAGDPMNEPGGLDQADAPIREMLQNTPVELHGALLVIAESTLGSHMNTARDMMGRYCPKTLHGLQAHRSATIEPYLQGPIEKHVLSDKDACSKLWEQYMKSPATEEERQSLHGQMKMVVRTEYLLRELKNCVEFEY
ncbi:hypothetical protein ACFQ3C_05045 [Seohaeicola saemankumensis]|uniref:Uncharacterized protein n=1 Tax=Seohaeicola saemankumensis TaxID=481181 RepID=A0ABW3TBV2_9RHOB